MTFGLVIQLVFLSSFFSIGIHMNSYEGDLFYFLRWMTKEAPDWIQKPVVWCVSCMGSIWSLIVMGVYHMLIGLPEMFWYKYVLLWLIVAVVASGVNGFIYTLFSAFREWAIKLEGENMDGDIKVD